jgi:hypothetical protein
MLECRKIRDPLTNPLHRKVVAYNTFGDDRYYSFEESFVICGALMNDDDDDDDNDDTVDHADHDFQWKLQFRR